jgi:hypothetical protein
MGFNWCCRRARKADLVAPVQDQIGHQAKVHQHSSGDRGRRPVVSDHQACEDVGQRGGLDEIDPGLIAAEAAQFFGKAADVALDERLRRLVLPQLLQFFKWRHGSPRS